ncbi:MAG: DNA polymerase sliding clamp [Methanospirillum sp.]|nr:DNA polymerase sliding clamp [Methanospirillum sp.]
MLRATIDADVFREAVDAVAALVSECRLHIDGGGMRTRAVDTANVAMVSLELAPDAFEVFEASERALGIDVTKLKNIVGTVNRGEKLMLSVPEGGQRLNLAFQSYQYSLTLLDPNTIRKDPNAPALELPGRVVLEGARLTNAIKAASVVSDKIALGIDPEARAFFMEAEGDTDNIRFALGSDEVESLSDVRARSLFSLDYLKDMAKAMSRASTVEIGIGIDHPVRFTFEIANGKGRVVYLLAPRIEAD